MKVGIIGCGAVAEEFYARCLPAIANVTIAYVSDRDATRAAHLAARTGARAVGLHELRSQAEAIVIATPPDSHHALVKSVLAPGKLVICEKPFVARVDHALELAPAEHLYVGHFRRLYPAVALARELVATLHFGPLRSIKVVEGKRFNWQARSDYFLAHPLGGVLLDTGSHAIDAALYVAGLDAAELAPRLVERDTDKPEPSHRVRAKLACGDVVLEISLSRYEMLANQLVFDFERGRMIVPSALASHVMLKSATARTVVYARRTFATNLEVFYEQCAAIFAGAAPQLHAARFVNTTRVLEAVVA